MTNIGNVSDDEFQTTVLDSETPVLVDFWAEWCVPCHMVSPVVEEIGNERGEHLKVVKLDIDSNPQATRTYGVMSFDQLLDPLQGRAGGCQGDRRQAEGRHPPGPVAAPHPSGRRLNDDPVAASRGRGADWLDADLPARR